MYKIHEIFYSLQGEGENVGKATVFVRFWGCNLSCSFCDTPQSKGEKRSLSAEDIWKEVRASHPKGLLSTVCFTGGEPLLQLDAELIQVGKAYGYRSFTLETNGTLSLSDPLRTEARFFWITVSPKNGHVDPRLVRIEADEIRFPFTEERQEEILYFVLSHRPNASLYVSPINEMRRVDLKNVQAAVRFCLDYPQFRLSTQMHKLWRIK